MTYETCESCGKSGEMDYDDGGVLDAWTCPEGR
jgi:hypothetical protein